MPGTRSYSGHHRQHDIRSLHPSSSMEDQNNSNISSHYSHYHGSTRQNGRGHRSPSSISRHYNSQYQRDRHASTSTILAKIKDPRFHTIVTALRTYGEDLKRDVQWYVDTMNGFLQVDPNEMDWALHQTTIIRRASQMASTHATPSENFSPNHSMKKPNPFATAAEAGDDLAASSLIENGIHKMSGIAGVSTVGPVQTNGHDLLRQPFGPHIMNPVPCNSTDTNGTNFFMGYHTLPCNMTGYRTMGHRNVNLPGPHIEEETDGDM